MIAIMIAIIIGQHDGPSQCSLVSAPQSVLHGLSRGDMGMYMYV